MTEFIASLSKCGAVGTGKGTPCEDVLVLDNIDEVMARFLPASGRGEQGCQEVKQPKSKPR
jgi:hypothetical protein